MDITRIKSDKGFVLSFITLIFIIIILGITTVNTNVISNLKYADSVISADTAYYYASYAIERSKSELNDLISNSSPETLMGYNNNPTLLVKDAQIKLNNLFDADEVIISQNNIVNLVSTFKQDDGNFLINTEIQLKGKSSNVNYTKVIKSKTIAIKGNTQIVNPNFGMPGEPDYINREIVSKLDYGSNIEVAN